MWVSNMKASRFLLILLMSLISNNLLFSQEIEGEIPETFLALSTPRTSYSIQEPGFSITYNSPGFMSLLLSEISLSFKDESLNSYSIGYGASYVLFGINKKLIGFENSYMYGNLSFGFFRYWTGNWYNMGSFGVSYLHEIKSKNFAIEFSIDGYFHHGQGGSGDFIPGKLSNYNTRGAVGNITISKALFNTLLFSFSSGLSYTSFQYVNFKYPYKEGSYFLFVSKEGANNKKNYVGEPKWKNYWLIPLGITISYKF